MNFCDPKECLLNCDWSKSVLLMWNNYNLHWYNGKLIMDSTHCSSSRWSFPCKILGSFSVLLLLIVRSYLSTALEWRKKFIWYVINLLDSCFLTSDIIAVSILTSGIIIKFSNSGIFFSRVIEVEESKRTKPECIQLLYLEVTYGRSLLYKDLYGLIEENSARPMENDDNAWEHMKGKTMSIIMLFGRSIWKHYGINGWVFM